MYMYEKPIIEGIHALFDNINLKLLKNHVDGTYLIINTRYLKNLQFTF